jgi:hypothetical protein
MCDAHGSCGSCGGGTGLSAAQIKMLEYAVRQKGYSIVYAFEDVPSYAYTVGLEKTSNHPELVVFGLNQEDSHTVLTEAAALVKDGASLGSVENMLRKTGNLTITFAEVPQHIAARYLCRAETFYKGGGFRGLQILWADEKGRFPMDGDCSEGVRNLQPVLAEIVR